MNRFYIPPEDWTAAASGEMSLLGDEAHHCARVFRTTPGTKIEVFNGLGEAARGEVLEASAKRVRLEIIEKSRSERLPVPITLAQAVPKGKAMEFVVQKAAEIGVERVVPLETERTVMRLAEMRNKRDKWQRVMLESCKQCGSNWLPEVSNPLKINEFSSMCDTERKLLAALTEKTARIRDFVVQAPKSVAIVIGPEGDFSPSEIEMLISTEFQPVSLGPNVLRAETAAIYGLSVLSDLVFTL